ncbi:MAG: phage holin family protein [bacterium]
MIFLLHIIFLSAAIFIVAELLPTVHIKNYGTALIVAFVYSLINFFFGWLLVLLTLPAIILTFGLFKFIINALMLAATDKLIEDFEIEGFGSTVLAAFLITLVDSLLKWIVF